MTTNTSLIKRAAILLLLTTALSSLSSQMRADSTGTCGGQAI